MSIKPVPFRSHDTFEQAIDASDKAKLERLDELQSLKGSAIQSFNYIGDEIHLNLSSGRVLIVTADPEGVAWRISNDDVAPSPLPILPIEIELTFQSDSGEPQEPYIWNWKEILESIVGETINSIHAVDGILYLRLVNVEDLMFTANLRLYEVGGSRFLFFYPDE